MLIGYLMMHYNSPLKRPRRGQMKTKLAALTLAWLSTLGVGNGYADTARDLNLPLMGEPANQVMSPRDEQLLGRRFMRQIREHLPLVKDTELNQYVQSLGRKLLASHAEINATDFNFFVIENPDINAFAIPGGFIGINTGLILASRNEAQLASVLAHEIAHVTQRHIARLQAAQGNTGLKTLAAIFAAILISQQSAQAGQAALLTGIAASQQSRINFTRLHEYEADRIGIQLLNDAGYDTSAAIDFFEILRRRIALNSSESLEFLRTHPLTTNRISEARNNASRLNDPLAIEDSVEFQLQQMKVILLHTNNPKGLKTALREGHLGASNAARLYGRILVDLQAGSAEKALPQAEALLELLPNIISARLIAAKVAGSVGDIARAERILLGITEIAPDNYAAVEYYLELLANQNRNDRGKNVIRGYLRNNDNPSPNIYRRYAEILKQTGEQTASHEAMAEHFTLLDDRAGAIAQLKLALRSATKGSNDESRISARLQLALKSGVDK